MTRPLDDLAARVEAEPVSYDLWIEAAITTSRYVGKDHWTPRQQDRFHDLAALGAYLDAADMLRPAATLLVVQNIGRERLSACISQHVGPSKQAHCSGEAEGPHAEARARLAAALRARARSTPGARHDRAEHGAVAGTGC